MWTQTYSNFIMCMRFFFGAYIHSHIHTYSYLSGEWVEVKARGSNYLFRLNTWILSHRWTCKIYVNDSRREMKIKWIWVRMRHTFYQKRNNARTAHKIYNSNNDRQGRDKNWIWHWHHTSWMREKSNIIDGTKMALDLSHRISSLSDLVSTFHFSFSVFVYLIRIF